MAFGKRAVAGLPPEVRAQLAENRTDLVVHHTEVKILKGYEPGTPLGDAALLGATEKTMTTPIEPECNVCHEKKTDVVLTLTGTCKPCHELQPAGAASAGQ